MSEANSTAVQEKPKKKKRSLWWLNLLLTLIVFAGGVVLGLRLYTMPEPYAMVERFFPQLVTQSAAAAAAPAVEVTPAPTPAPAEAPKPTEAPAPTEAPKPTETPAPTEAPKPTEAPAPTETPKPAETAEPEQTGEPETAAAADGFDAPTGILEGHVDSEKPEAPSPAADTPTETIGLDAALRAALKHAKADADKAEVYGVYKSIDVDTVVYRVEFSVDGAEYRYMINAATGEVEGWQKLRPSENADEASLDGDDALRNEGSEEAVSPNESDAEAETKGAKVPGGKK